MGEDSWKRNHGEGIVEEESRERNRVRGHLVASGRHLRASSEGIWRHLGNLEGIWEASGRHLGGIWRLLGGIWGLQGGSWEASGAKGAK